MSSRNLTVRPATGDDARALAALAREAFGSAMDCDWDANARGLVEGVRSGRVTVLVACDGRDVVGYVNLRTWLEGGWIDQIAVAASARRSGVASALLLAIEDAARSRSMRHVAAIARESDARSVAFWRASGWSLVGRVEGAVGGADGLLFNLRLGSR